jgi:hypothetical protein
MRLAQTIYGGCPHKLGLPYTKICDFHQASNDDTITESATPGVPGGGEELLLLITSCLKPGGQRCSIPKTWRDVREIVGAVMSGYLDGIATRDGFVTHSLFASICPCIDHATAATGSLSMSIFSDQECADTNHGVIFHRNAFDNPAGSVKEQMLKVEP